ncbi:hypothetical protein J6590_037384 [Homalodisca vitripennis]|nr:hypothetical protein J6590_037384 [Homalodisca vitripennis]
MGMCFGKKKQGSTSQEQQGEQAADAMKAATFDVKPRRLANPYLAWWRIMGFMLPEHLAGTGTLNSNT